nr:IS66 family insertion sequence element accessory protein TnpB [uncultured Ruminococcus sp.]
MAKGLQNIKENNNIAEWSRQVEECRNSGLSVRSWCEQHQIADSTFHYHQQKVWKALQKSSQFVEVPLSFDEIRDNIIAVNKIAASVRIGGICAEVHNGADEATLTAIFRALKSC